jgi:hypothetical protein
MNLNSVKSAVGSLTDLVLMLLALGIALSLLAGTQVPFLGDVVTNITGMVKKLGDAGIVGLISLGVILWLFSNRNVS